jgi:WD40-like Beta Propeller Repeat
VSPSFAGSPGRVGRRDALTWVVLGAVAIIAAAAVADALRGDPAPSASVRHLEESGPLTGKELPEPGVLPGRLVFTSLAGCRPQALSLQTLTLGARGPSLECELWVSPRADVAVVSRAPALGLRGSRVALLELGSRPRLLQPLGVLRGEPSWSPDGERLAWCTPGGETVVLVRATGARSRVEGCRPHIAPDGSVLTRPPSPLATTLLRDGEVLLDAADLARGFPADGDGPLDLVGYDARPNGILAVVAVRFESGRRPRRVLQLWRERTLEAVVPLPELGLPAGYGRLGEHVEFGPSGREVAVAFPGAGKPMVVVELETRTLAVGPVSQHGFAWSPDGTWLALSTGAEIRILGPDREEPAYVLPVGAAALAWR